MTSIVVTRKELWVMCKEIIFMCEFILILKILNLGEKFIDFIYH